MVTLGDSMKNSGRTQYDGIPGVNPGGFSKKKTMKETREKSLQESLDMEEIF